MIDASFTVDRLAGMLLLVDRVESITIGVVVSMPRTGSFGHVWCEWLSV